MIANNHSPYEETKYTVTCFVCKTVSPQIYRIENYVSGFKVAHPTLGFIIFEGRYTPERVARSKHFGGFTYLQRKKAYKKVKAKFPVYVCKECTRKHLQHSSKTRTYNKDSKILKSKEIEAPTFCEKIINFFLF